MQTTELIQLIVQLPTLILVLVFVLVVVIVVELDCTVNEMFSIYSGPSHGANRLNVLS